jgi:N-acetylglutamate synthase-like GNAT family acetyltransferase
VGTDILEESLPRMERVRSRVAKESDMPSIRTHIERFQLDNENMSFEQFIVAEKGSSIIGFGRIKHYKSCYELACLGVLEPYRNQGIGTAIVKKMMEVFPDNEIWITTDIPKYFERFGFELAKDAPQEIKDKIKGVCHTKHHPDAVIMSLRKS